MADSNTPFLLFPIEHINEWMGGGAEGTVNKPSPTTVLVLSSLEVSGLRLLLNSSSPCWDPRPRCSHLNTLWTPLLVGLVWVCFESYTSINIFTGLNMCVLVLEANLWAVRVQYCAPSEPCFIEASGRGLLLGVVASRFMLPTFYIILVFELHSLVLSTYSWLCPQDHSGSAQGSCSARNWTWGLCMPDVCFIPLSYLSSPKRLILLECWKLRAS